MSSLPARGRVVLPCNYAVCTGWRVCCTIVRRCAS